MALTEQLPRLMTTDELGAYLGVPKSTVYTWRTHGGGPPGIKVGRHVRYSATDVEHWLETRRRSDDGSLERHGGDR